MIKEIDIRNTFNAAEESIPNLDGHNIRVAERRILWSKLAQRAPAIVPSKVTVIHDPESGLGDEDSEYKEVPSGLGDNDPEYGSGTRYGDGLEHQTSKEELEQLLQSQTPIAKSNHLIIKHKTAQLTGPEAMEAEWRAGRSVVTPEQVAKWQQPQAGEEPEAIPTSRIERGMAQLTQNQQAARQQAVTHQRPVVRPVAAPVRPAVPVTRSVNPSFDLRQTMDSPTGILQPQMYTPGPNDPNYVVPAPDLGYTPGPDDVNYVGANKSLQGLLKVADYLNKKYR